jgi:hypothetical protein
MRTAAFLLLLLSSGCATSPYFADRGRDLSDIFTATYGSNLGAKARVGPVHAGLFLGSDIGGLRGGDFKGEYSAPFGDILDVETTYFYIEDFREYTMTTARDRGKQQGGEGYMGLSLGGATLQPARPASWRINIPYYTQIEVAGGLLFGARLGFNPGELLDFLLGWTALDIFDDDIATQKPIAPKHDAQQDVAVTHSNPSTHSP